MKRCENVFSHSAGKEDESRYFLFRIFHSNIYFFKSSENLFFRMPLNRHFWEQHNLCFFNMFSSFQYICQLKNLIFKNQVGSHNIFHRIKFYWNLGFLFCCIEKVYYSRMTQYSKTCLTSAVQEHCFFQLWANLNLSSPLNPNNWCIKSI